MHPEYATPFWTNVKPVCGKCKLLLCQVGILWICEFNKNNFLLVITKSNKENIYCDGKGSIPSCLNNGRHVSRSNKAICSWMLQNIGEKILSLYFLCLKEWNCIVVRVECIWILWQRIQSVFYDKFCIYRSPWDTCTDRKTLQYW